MNENITILNDGEKAISNKLCEILENNIDTIFLKFKENNKQLLCESIYIINFESSFDFLSKVLESFLCFFQTVDVQIPCSFGNRAISKGITENIIFPFFDNIYSFRLY